MTIRVNSGELTEEEAIGSICDLKIIIYGAGSAGCGIARQLADVIADRAESQLNKLEKVFILLIGMVWYAIS